MRADGEIGLDSRHLGLVPAAEVPGIREKIDRAAACLEIDWERLFAVARAAAPANAPLPDFGRPLDGLRMGVAHDAAFGFYYEANLEMLRRMGAELALSLIHL